jgi:hypothetical protein
MKTQGIFLIDKWSLLDQNVDPGVHKILFTYQRQERLDEVLQGLRNSFFDRRNCIMIIRQAQQLIFNFTFNLLIHKLKGSAE